ncbi:MAG: hypothetical protein KHX03_01530 [Clostridium sp.]|nr:hypothetical protein [Clostridium sp.]
MIVNNFSNSFSTPLRDYQKEKEDLIQKNYNHIYAHEMAHKAAGGSFAGAISIEKNAEGIPVAGHVPIKMPVLDRNNPQKTIDHADIVIKAALAPSDPSSQDYKVAAEAQSLKSRAKSLKSGNKLDFMA